MSDGSAAVTRAILVTYARLTTELWPTLHPDLPERSRSWPGRSEAELRRELDGFVAELSRPGCTFGLFWKLARTAVHDGRPRPDSRLTYEGANVNFLAAAGVARLEDLVGRDDFDGFPWGAQGARFVADDRRVMKSGEIIDYIERRLVDGSFDWNRVGKAAIVGEAGSVYGVMGMYETLDPEEGRKAYWQQLTRQNAVA